MNASIGLGEPPLSITTKSLNLRCSQEKVDLQKIEFILENAPKATNSTGLSPLSNLAYSVQQAP